MSVNVAVVGLGFMGVTHLKAYQQIENVRIAALSARNAPMDGVIKAPGGNIGEHEDLRFDPSSLRITSDYSELLADPEIHVIDLCVPTLAHPEMAIAALEAGKHVICEKPLARTAEAARAIEAAAAKASGFFMPAMCIRFWPPYAWLKAAIDDQRFGRVRSAKFRRVCEPPVWGRDHFFDGKKSGGAILDLHIHDADFVQYCFGRPQSVYAQGFTRYSGEIDHLMVQYQVANGPAVSAEGGWVMGMGFGFEMSFTVIFEHATVDFHSGRGADGLKVFHTEQEPETIDPGPGDGYLGELSYFIDCIRNQRPPAIVTARDGASAVEICEAEGRSIREGTIVCL